MIFFFFFCVCFRIYAITIIILLWILKTDPPFLFTSLQDMKWNHESRISRGDAGIQKAPFQNSLLGELLNYQVQKTKSARTLGYYPRCSSLLKVLEWSFVNILVDTFLKAILGCVHWYIIFTSPVFENWLSTTHY